VEAAVKDAARATVAMREDEGRRLHADLEERLAGDRGGARRDRGAGAGAAGAERDRLRERGPRAGGGMAVDEDRLAQEIAYLAERWDVNEELVRFRSHNELFRELLAAEREPVGKRLSFLVQEMHREANTIGSKANHAAIAHRWSRSRRRSSGCASRWRTSSDAPATRPSARRSRSCFAAPSGAGKTTIARRAAASGAATWSSRSPPPPAPRLRARRGGLPLRGEPEFRRMIAAGELIEWAEVHGNLYGTPRRNVARRARRPLPAAGHRRAGLAQIRRAVPEAVLVFVLPPSGERAGASG
jgi:hypothetical protein